MTKGPAKTARTLPPGMKSIAVVTIFNAKTLDPREVKEVAGFLRKQAWNLEHRQQYLAKQYRAQCLKRENGTFTMQAFGQDLRTL